MTMTIFTIGHSSRRLEEFAALLETHGIRAVVDVRAYPRSRRHPQFDTDNLAIFLAGRDIVYVHQPALGGMRKPGPAPSLNTAIEEPGFRAYADHMQTAEFATGLAELCELAERQGPATIMCAEADWRRCHRQLITDALLARGVEVVHVDSAAPGEAAAMTGHARVERDRVIYPAPQGDLFD